MVEKGEDTVLYEEAERSRKSGDFKTALAKYQDLVKRFPQSEHYDASRCRVGACYLGMDNAPEAIKALSVFVRDNPWGAYRGEARIY